MACGVCRADATLSTAALCARCTDERLSQHRSKLQRAAHSIAQLAEGCYALVDATERETNAALAAATRSRDRLRDAHDRTAREMDGRRAKLETARQQLDRRKANLARARAGLSLASTIEADCTSLAARCVGVERSIATERQRLIVDAMTAFAVPADGASIFGLSLPHSDQLRRNQTLEASAATLHTAMLIRLLALYLDVRLPFVIVAGPKPTIRAASASAWTSKWSTPAQPLDLSPREKDRPSATAKEASGSTSVTGFVTALAMLAYDAAFIAHSLGLAITLGTAARTLQTLARLPSAPSFVPQPDPAFAALDFTSLLDRFMRDAASSAARGRKASSAKATAPIDEWDIVESLDVEPVSVGRLGSV